MTADSVLQRNFQEFAGVDLRSNDANRRPRFARDVLNVEYQQNNSLGCKKGHKGIAKSAGGGGLETYIRSKPDRTTEEIVCTIDDNLKIQKVGVVTVSYTGSATDPSIEIVPDKIGADLSSATFAFYCRVIENGVTVLNQNLGVGIDEDPFYTVAQLVSAIDGLTNFSCTATGDTTGPAAFLPITISSISSSLTISFYYWQTVWSPTANPFSQFWATSSSDDFELASLFNHGGRFYIATGFGPLRKYDGVATYRVGMPAANRDLPALALGSASAGLLTGTYSWFVTYEHIDANGKLVEGDASNLVTATLSSQQQAITIPTIQSTSGFQTSRAAINGNQTGTTLTVFSGHTMQIGQTALFNNSTGELVTRLITGATATSITISGAAVTVLSGAVVSANLRINIWRNRAGGSLPYLVKTLVHDSGVTSVSFTDNTPDASIEIEYEEPVGSHGLPPEDLKYLTAYKGLLIGATGKDDIVWFTDPDGPEYWANETSSNFILKSKANGNIVGLGANREVLFGFKKTQTVAISGDLPNGNYRQEIASDTIGTDSHHSIVDVENTLWFYSSTHGVRRFLGNSLAEDVGYRVYPLITDRAYVDSDTIVHRRVVAQVYSDKQLVYFFLPSETNLAPNQSSKTLVADYRSQLDLESEYDPAGKLTNQFPKIRWWIMDGINFGGGATIAQNKLIWTERRYSDSLGAIEAPLVQRLDNGNEYDCTAHAAPFSWVYEFSWDDLDTQELLKRFVRISLFSLPRGYSPSFNITASTELNLINGAPHCRKLINFGGTGGTGGFGTWPFGVPPFGDPTISRRVFELRPNQATSIKLRLETLVWRQDPLISGVVMEAVPAFKPKVVR